ncbi:656_t:CDS:2 [Racocetra fulgida]|uniref:656_t:CDS:1 n=1 Tax=Racocetra fulgida TaxID=60492 RepID=A0A9N9B4Y4_9GLOM|nr:656_t:CDS:2 [Racocetra fulgida]
MSSPDDINDEESTSTEISGSNTQQGIAGRPFNPVWNYFNQLEKKKNGHYSATPMEAQLLYYKQLTENDESQNSSKKRKADTKNKEDILKYVESQELPSKRQEQLEDGMCRAFVCAGISFNVAKNEIFRAWLQELRPGFNIPSPKTLAGRIFNKQLIKVEMKMENELQDKKNITLGRGFKRGQYKKIAKYASTLWKAFGKSKESCRQLLGQLASYKDNEPPYNDPFEPDCQTLLTWWRAIEDVYDYLPFEKVEALAKIHRYYTTHTKEEISYINRELTLEDVLVVANEAGDFDLNHEVFKEKGQSNNTESNSENVVEEQPNYNYDVDSLVDEVFT